VVERFPQHVVALQADLDRIQDALEPANHEVRAPRVLEEEDETPGTEHPLDLRYRHTILGMLHKDRVHTTVKDASANSSR
jgi:hypothetical protein